MSQSLEGNFRFFSIFTSRGCPKNCIFCGSHNTFGRRFRARSKQNVLDEVDWLIRNYQVEELQFQDDNLTLDRKRVEEILGGIKERNIPWTIPNGLDTNTLDRDLLEKIKQSGGRDICIAVESGNQRVLEMIHKHINLEKIKRLIKDMRDLGIYSKAFFMLGFPGETKKEMYDTVNYAFILRADWTMFSIVNPLPGTEMHKIAKDYIVGDMDNIGYSNANLKTEEFTPEEVENLVDKANININFIYNYNLNGGNINWAIRDFKRISERYPGHIVARESLKKAYEGLYSSRVRN
jgi:magnesium-protoporphyrin IX monomethyl ester (oxidative) cyclase